MSDNVPQEELAATNGALAMSLLPIRCPYCGDHISAELTYTAARYSEHRSLTAYECDNYLCDARWDGQGEPERGPAPSSGSRSVSSLGAPLGPLGLGHQK